MKYNTIYNATKRKLSLSEFLKKYKKPYRYGKINRESKQ